MKKHKKPTKPQSQTIPIIYNLPTTEAATGGVL